MELVDSGNFTLSAETAVGGVSAEILPPSAATKAIQTTADLKRFMLAQVVKGLLAATSINRATPLRAERRGEAAIGRGRFAVKTWHGNSDFTKILLLAGYFSSKT